MNIMKLNRLFALVAVAVMTVGCYEKFETVAPREVYSDESFEQKFPDAVHITIAELKYAFGDISNTGVNSAWSNTKYKLIGEDIFAHEDVYIKGVVTSDDTEGNVYKSLYIQDETSGIELKLNNNVGIRYKKVTAEEAGTYLHNVTLADGTVLMPLIIEWSSSEGNSVSDLLAVMLAEAEARGYDTSKLIWVDQSRNIAAQK